MQTHHPDNIAILIIDDISNLTLLYQNQIYLFRHTANIFGLFSKNIHIKIADPLLGRSAIEYCMCVFCL